VSGTRGKTNSLAPLQYGQIINSASLQPSQMFGQFDLNQPANQSGCPPPPQPAGPSPQSAQQAPPQNTASLQNIASQLVHQRYLHFYYYVRFMSNMPKDRNYQILTVWLLSKIILVIMFPQSYFKLDIFLGSILNIMLTSIFSEQECKRINSMDHSSTHSLSNLVSRRAITMLIRLHLTRRYIQYRTNLFLKINNDC
jgi:hypothetical protein